MTYLFQSERLGFRNWIDSDLKKLHSINTDDEVMEFFPSHSSMKETSLFIQRMQESIEHKGYGYFAVDEINTRNFIGFIGILDQTYEASFMPSIDIGWRLNKSYWGKGYATEGAKACIHHAFKTLELKSLVSIAPKLNQKSINVMEKIGMTKHLEFKHPKIENYSPLQDCVCYKITV